MVEAPFQKISKTQVLNLQKDYLQAIAKRNKEEKEFFKQFVDDYYSVLVELKSTQTTLRHKKVELEQIKDLKGDPISERKAKEELANIKNQISQ